MFKRYEGESEYEFIYRVCSNKEAIGTWNDVADMLNEALGYEYTDSKYRKDYQSFQKMFKANEPKFTNIDAQLEDIKEERRILAREKSNICDERSALSRQIRELARNESTLDMVKRVISECDVEPFEYTSSPIINGDNDLIVHLTDLHCGAEIDSYFNSYNKNIVSDRLSKYLDEIFTIQERHDSRRCYLILGGDLITGLIHFSIRCESNENVVEQIKTASTIISGFAYNLAQRFEEVHIFSTPGNHSRAIADKKLSLKGENLDELIPFYMEAKLEKQTNVHICRNIVDESIATFKVRGRDIFAAHGDKDEPDRVVQSLTMLIGTKPYMVFLGHRHKNGMSTVFNSKVIESGSVMGMDNFSLDRRFVGRPEQAVAVVSDRGFECLYDIQLD